MRQSQLKIAQWGCAVTLLLMATLLSGMVFGQVAGAISNTYFDSGDTNRSGESYVLSVGETQYVRKSAANLKVYFPKKNGKITFHGYNYCPGGSDAGDIFSGNITTYDISSPGGKIDGKSSPTFFYGTYKKASSNDCNASKAASKKTISVTDAAYDDKLNLYFVTIAVTHVQKKSGYDNIQNTFKVSTPTTGGTISHEGGKGKGYEVTMEHAGSSGHTNYNIKFGTDCKVKKNPVRIALYDLDNDGGSGAQLGGKVTVSLKANGKTRPIKVTTESVASKVKMTGLVNSAKPSGDNKTVYLYFNADFKTGEKYILHMDNVYHNNTIQFQTPFDGKYYDKPCSPPPPGGSKVWDATPTTAMSLQPNSTGGSVAKKGTSANPTWVKPGDTVRWEHTVTNNLTSERKTTTKITSTIKRKGETNLPDRGWAKDKSPGASKTYKAGDGGDKSGWMKKVITDDDMGKTFCQRMGINPSGINKNGKLKGEVNSAWRCVLVTATGGDIEASVTASPSIYSYYPTLTAKAEVSSTGFPVVDRFKKKDYTRTGYSWKIFEVKFTKQPLGSIAESTVADCKSVTDKAPYKNIMVAGSCKEAGSGSNLFATGKSPTVTAPNKQQGPDPIGTWTCYTLQYLINPKPLATLRNTTSGDIRKFVDDWNDANQTSKEPTRWNDKRWKSGGEWKGQAAKNRADEYKKYKEAVPLDPVRYLFTPFDEDSCSVSGIDPKVQIRGNDLKVDGAINTSVRRNSQGAFGSSGEYSVLSGGLNSGMASGSGLLAGAAQGSLQASWSPLTFTNNTASFGNFDSVPVDTDEPEPTAGDVIEGNATWSGLPSAATADGARKVYKINGTLVVSGNLQYAATYTKISKIPRVIIIADNIQIEPGVTRIDPWLIAQNISTCGAPRGAAWGDSAGEALSGANLKIGDCNNPLTFNGAVSVDNLYLYRTGGSRVLRSDLPGAKWSPDTVDPNTYCEGSCATGANERRYALSAPAEVFNLRPDIYLSSLSGMKTHRPVATTDRITELPPRF